jgi:NADH dehydrogenase
MTEETSHESDAAKGHTVLVVGGTGMLGEPVAKRMAEDGHRVRVLTRRVEAARHRFPSPFEVAQGDVEDREALAAALDGCTAVHLSLDGAGDWDIERRGAVAVSELAAKHGLMRITTISGASACEENAWFPMTRAKLAAERAIADCGVPFTVFRCTMFMEMLPNFVRGTKAIVMGKVPQRWRFIAAGDYARMVSTSLSNERAEGKTLYVYGPEALTIEEAVERYRAACAPEAKLTHVPFWILSIMALFPGRERLRRVGLPLMRYFAKVSELGDGAEANELLGAPSTTLDDWCREAAAR